MDNKINKILINKILKKGNNSPQELYTIAASLGLEIKVISIYDLKEVKKNINYIILITPSPEIKNGHWVALRNNNYFDPYGVPPSQVLTSSIPNLKYSNHQIQSLKMNYCGIFCIYWLYFMKKNKTYQKAMNDMMKYFYDYNTLKL